LELALTWLFINSDAESLLNRKLLQEGQASVLLQKDTTESNKLHRSWRRSKFCKDVDKLLSGADIGEGGSGSPHTDDQDSDADEPPLQPVPDLPDSPGFTGAPLHSTALRQTPFTQLITDKVSSLAMVANPYGQAFHRTDSSFQELPWSILTNIKSVHSASSE
jgi:hypothetical protein